MSLPSSSTVVEEFRQETEKGGVVPSSLTIDIPLSSSAPPQPSPPRTSSSSLTSSSPSLKDHVFICAYAPNASVSDYAKAASVGCTAFELELDPAGPSDVIPEGRPGNTPPLIHDNDNNDIRLAVSSRQGQGCGTGCCSRAPVLEDVLVEIAARLQIRKYRLKKERLKTMATMNNNNNSNSRHLTMWTYRKYAQTFRRHSSSARDPPVFLFIKHHWDQSRQDRLLPKVCSQVYSAFGKNNVFQWDVESDRSLWYNTTYEEARGKVFIVSCTSVTHGSVPDWNAAACDSLQSRFMLDVPATGPNLEAVRDIKAACNKKRESDDTTVSMTAGGVVVRVCFPPSSTCSLSCNLCRDLRSVVGMVDGMEKMHRWIPYVNFLKVDVSTRYGMAVAEGFMKKIVTPL